MVLRELFQFDDLVNITEELVISELDRRLSEDLSDSDLNQDIVLDIAAFALNLLKPMYRVNLMGRIYAHAFEELYHDEIAEAVRKAIQKILIDK